MWTRSVPPAGALSAIQPAHPAHRSEGSRRLCHVDSITGTAAGRGALLKSRADELAARGAESAVSPRRPSERGNVRQSAATSAPLMSPAAPVMSRDNNGALPLSQLRSPSSSSASSRSMTPEPAAGQRPGLCACASATTCPTTARRRARRHPRRTRRPASTRSAAARRCAPRPRRFYRSDRDLRYIARLD